MEDGHISVPFASSPVETPCRAVRRLDDARRERELGAQTYSNTASQLCGQCALLLGWRPHEFWDATPAELACTLSAYAPQGEAPPNPDDIQKLMELFPDG